jgi:hypothetical protein
MHELNSGRRIARAISIFMGIAQVSDFQGMIRKRGNRFSLAKNAKRVCAEIMLEQRDEIMMRFHSIAS